MGNRHSVIPLGSAAVLLVLCAAFFSLPLVADASRGERPRGIPEILIQRLCDRQEALAHRLSRPLIHPSFCNAPEPEEPSVEISAEPMTITEGNSATLSWDSENAESCTASNGWSGERELQGSEEVSPEETTTYTITCTGDGGSDSDSVTVTVNQSEPEDPTVNLTANPESIDEGSSSLLSWSSTNASTCEKSGGWSGATTTSGTLAVSPSATTTYTITCTGDGGSAVDSVTVKVVLTPEEPDAPTVNLVAAPTTVTPGAGSATTTLTWTTTNATGCTASGGTFTGSKVVNGSEIITPSATTTYALECFGAGGTTTDSVIVNFVPTPSEEPDPTVTLTANPTSVTPGAGSATSTLSWTTTNATSCTASGGSFTGTKATSSSEIVSPVATTTYTLECTGPGGTAQDTATVNFVPAPNPVNNLLISEVHYDLANDNSQGVEPGNEWIELYNATNGTLDLTGYSIVDTSGASTTIPNGTMLPSGAFLILTASSTTANFHDIPGSTVVVVVSGELGNGLGNTGDDILLRNDEGNAVDEVSWGTDTNAFSPAAPDAPAGQSIGRINLTTDTGTAADWQIQTPNPGE